jgi:hypothetical protein
VVAGLLAMSISVSAQAWTPPAGVGSITFVSQRIDNTGHLLNDGSLLPDGKSTSAAIYLEAEYAITDRFSTSVGIPYVFSKYKGPGETPFNFLPVDSCFCWHSGWQDFGVTARYNVVNGLFALTPSISAGVPSHDYNFRGEAVVGRNLKEVRLGLDAGRRLDMISRNLSIQGHYTYAIVERVLGVPNNRSNAGIEGNVLVTRRLSTRVFASFQRTHGGLRVPFDLEGYPERIFQHDRLLRDNYFHLGSGASYSFSRFDVFGTYIHFISGTNSHAGRTYSAGLSVPFEIAP